MKLLKHLFLAVTLLVLFQAAWAAEETHKEAAAQFLQQLDQGNYEAVYSRSIALLTDNVPLKAFAKQMDAAKAMVGQRKRRTLVKTTHHTNFNNQPGNYYVYRYKSSYANLPDAADVLTVVKVDGKWKFAGYQIVRADSVPKGF